MVKRRVQGIVWIATCALGLTGLSPVVADDFNPGPREAVSIQMSESKQSFHVLREDIPLGDIDLYINQSGAFVPLDSLLAKLGYSFYRDDASQMAQITFPDGATLTLHLDTKEYMQAGDMHSLADTDYIILGSNIFLSTSFINSVFPIGLSVDLAARKLRIENAGMTPVPEPLVQQSTPVAEAKTEDEGATPIAAPETPEDSSPAPQTDTDMAPVPLAAPRIPVIVDDYINRRTSVVPALEVPGNDVLRSFEQIRQQEQKMSAVPATEAPVPTEAAIASPSPANDKPFNSAEAETLILQPKIKRAPASDGFIEALQSGDTVYLPFDDLMALLEFDIKTDDAAGTAAGSFMAPPRAFSLDLAKQEVYVDKVRQTLDKDDIIQKNGILYVSTAAFEKWFGITASVQLQSMVLKLDSVAILPVEARIARHALWQKLLSTNVDNTNDYVRIENPYQLAAWPAVDVNLSTSMQHTDNKSISGLGSYAILSGGDLGYMTTNFFATGSDKTPIANLRLTTGRKDPDGDLLGGLHATNFSVGDIESPSLANVTSDPVGRGVLMSNRDLNASSSFDTHTFTGNAVPGWEVEIYQNNMLLQFQTVGQDGRYTFTDIPLFYGNNDFRIMLYGPQGQTEEHDETILIGSSILKENKFEYTVSANQKELGALDSLSSPTHSITASSALRALTEMRYGVNKWMTAGMSLAQTTVPQLSGENVEHRYASTTVDADLGRAFIDLNGVQDLNKGWMMGVIGLTSVDDINIRMRHRQYNAFESETEDLGNQHKMDSELDANGQFYAPIIQDYNMQWKVERETFQQLPEKTTYSSTFSKGFWGSSFSNTLDYVKSDITQTLGTVGFQTRFGNTLVRADAQYQAMPSPNLQEATLTTQYRINENVTAQTQIDNQLTEANTVTATQGVNWDFKNYRLSLIGSVDDKHAVFVGLSLVFSLARDPLHDMWHMQRQGAANAGSIATRIFEDDHYSNQYDEGDRIIADAQPRVNHTPLSLSAGDGTFISPVNAYEPIDVSVDPTSLKDPMLSPGSAGYRVITRPGDVVSLDLPVISTSEVDGEIDIEDDAGVRAGLNDIVVELLDSGGHVVQRVISEADGYFIFQKIRPGDYTLSVPEEALEEYDATLTAPVLIKIAKSSDFYTGENILLHTKAYKPSKHRKHMMPSFKGQTSATRPSSSGVTEIPGPLTPQDLGGSMPSAVPISSDSMSPTTIAPQTPEPEQVETPAPAAAPTVSPESDLAPIPSPVPVSSDSLALPNAIETSPEVAQPETTTPIPSAPVIPFQKESDTPPTPAPTSVPEPALETMPIPLPEPEPQSQNSPVPLAAPEAPTQPLPAPVSE